MFIGVLSEWHQPQPIEMCCLYYFNALSGHVVCNEGFLFHPCNISTITIMLTPTNIVENKIK